MARAELVRLGRAAALLAASGALIAVAWLALQDSTGSSAALAEVLALSLAPALAAALTRRWWVGLAALLVGFVPAAAVAMGVSLVDMRPGERDFFGPVWGAIEDGMRDFYELQLPFSPADYPEAAGIVLLAVYGFVASCGLLLVLGRPLLAALVLLVGVGWPVTPAAAAGGIAPLEVGALVLGLLLLVFFAAQSGRRPLRTLVQAAVLGAVVVFAAVGASTSGAVAKDAFLSWRSWDPYDAPTDPVGVRYVWSSNYRGITFPDEETVVLRIKAPDRARYWRATTLDEYTGVGWRERLDPGPPRTPRQLEAALDDPLLPEAARDDESWVRQDVEVVALSDTHLVAASHPVRWRPGAQNPVQYAQNGVVLAPEGLVIGETYTVWSYAPEVEPKALSNLPASYPEQILPYLEVVPDVRFPVFGAERRAATVDRLFAERADDALLAQYEGVYEQAREVVGDAATPYLAAASLEAWFRSEGGFVYAEQPEQPVGPVPPLVDFVLRTKAGYCQHYAGAMAVMLRMLGIPSRVAVGFTSGDYDERKQEWTVTDHNAHAWVEVYFPEFGWLPFDPTPGRGELSAAYSTASSAFPSGLGSRDALGVSPEALSTILRQRLEQTRGAGGAPTAPGAAELDGDGGGIGIAGLVVLVLGGALALFLGIKAARRALRFRSRDPRQTAAACRRDLVAFLADQGVTVSDATTLAELREFVEREYRVNARPFVRAAAAARFGPPGGAAEAAGRARRELRTLQRQLRRELGTANRVRGALSIRSLTV